MVFESGIVFLIVPFPDHCLHVPFNILYERKSKSQLPDSFLPDRVTDKIALIMFHCHEISEVG